MSHFRLIAETNFIVHVIHDETHCGFIFERVLAAEIDLILPEICLFEAQTAVHFFCQDRHYLAQRCRYIARELARCSRRESSEINARHFFQAENILSEQNQIDTKRCLEVITQCQKMAQIISVTPDILARKAVLELNPAYGRQNDGQPQLRGTDALIYAAVLDFWQTNSAVVPTVFFTEDGHFQSDQVQRDCQRHHVRFMDSAGDVVKFFKANTTDCEHGPN